MEQKNIAKKDCPECRNLPEGKVIIGHDHRQDIVHVHVIVIHKPTAQSTSYDMPLSRVREYVKFSVKQFCEFHTTNESVNDDDFLVVEVHHGSMLTRVSSLTNL
jgi:hypothetical protein